MPFLIGRGENNTLPLFTWRRIKGRFPYMIGRGENNTLPIF